ncbi:MAG: cold shock domain-containing protein, partial [Candidatus Marinimicrobia bacterium]|nr:cold shock domain-containing protein [Candidatus Neomarinimicrobiota bacterium]
MDKGKVKTIHDKGFGFISSDALDKDVFCPPNIVQNENLIEGDYVEFDYEKDRRDSEKIRVVQLNKIDAPVNPLFEKALKIDQLDAKQYDVFIEEVKHYVN